MNIKGLEERERQFCAESNGNKNHNENKIIIFSKQFQSYLLSGPSLFTKQFIPSNQEAKKQRKYHCVQSPLGPLIDRDSSSITFQCISHKLGDMLMLKDRPVTVSELPASPKSVLKPCNKTGCFHFLLMSLLCFTEIIKYLWV